MDNHMKSHALLHCLSAIIITMTSSVSAEQNPPSVRSNTVDSKIYLKDITTGIKVDKKYFTEISKLSTGGYHAKYQYFGEMQDIAISTNKNDEIYSYIMLFKVSIDELRVALEEKFTKTNARQIKFYCIAADRGIVAGTECTLRHKNQRLILEKYTLKENPKNQDNKVYLIDDDLERLAAFEEREVEERKNAQQKKKAKDDI